MFTSVRARAVYIKSKPPGKLVLDGMAEIGAHGQSWLVNMERRRVILRGYANLKTALTLRLGWCRRNLPIPRIPGNPALQIGGLAEIEGPDPEGAAPLRRTKTNAVGVGFRGDGGDDLEVRAVLGLLLQKESFLVAGMVGPREQDAANGVRDQGGFEVSGSAGRSGGRIPDRYLGDGFSIGDDFGRVPGIILRFVKPIDILGIG